MIPTPFSLHTEDLVLDDLRQRLARTRWPDEPPGPAWATGSSVAYIHALVEHWRTGFDWLVHEIALSRFHEYTVPLAGIDLHYIHELGQGPAHTEILRKPQFTAHLHTRSAARSNSFRLHNPTPSAHSGRVFSLARK